MKHTDVAAVETLLLRLVELNTAIQAMAGEFRDTLRIAVCRLDALRPTATGGTHGRVDYDRHGANGRRVDKREELPAVA